MIQATISQVKNRLSHYLRLVRGGEEVQILDRKTPVARLLHVSQVASEGGRAPWIQEVIDMGIVTPPKGRGLAADALRRDRIPGVRPGSGVLKALIEERESGR
jgi:antitoxin (DNA-binding transcriptional repressor) of toxin-antitoxin stability system